MQDKALSISKDPAVQTDVDSVIDTLLVALLQSVIQFICHRCAVSGLVLTSRMRSCHVAMLVTTL